MNSLSIKGKTLRGVITYEILPDGCLNGVYSNNAQKTNGEIFNEIAKRKPGQIKGEISGQYICCYIDSDYNVHECELKVTGILNANYEFEWHKQGVKMFEGTGWRTKQNQLTISYWDC